ncbi:hypothetical protein I549_3608 [Mycobacterium avium subsp. avium 2285 (R)]|nr:hypothetical protein I549_3608 [Mycobacterium avium subsp. avium 2285 (R)]
MVANPRSRFLVVAAGQPGAAGVPPGAPRAGLPTGRTEDAHEPVA